MHKMWDLCPKPLAIDLPPDGRSFSLCNLMLKRGDFSLSCAILCSDIPQSMHILILAISFICVIINVLTSLSE